MIIGIAGKAGSGKDLVGNIIQYLTACRKYEGMDCFNADYVNKGFDLEADYTNISKWETKKFADKLKDIVCLLIGCTREQLEDREFKEKELGEEWWYYKGEVGIYPHNTPYGANKTLPLIKTTPRVLLQEIGTNLFRNQLHPNIWVNALMSEYKTYGETKPFFNKTPLDNSYPFWCITDVRFPNEAAAVKAKGGINIRINRYPKSIMSCKPGENPKEIIFNESNKSHIDLYKGECLRQHESETALDNYNDWDYIIENNSTIEDLIKKVKEILIKEKII